MGLVNAVTADLDGEVDRLAQQVAKQLVDAAATGAPPGVLDVSA